MSPLERLRLAIIVPSLHVGGMERVVSVLLEEWAKDDRTELHLILYGRYRDVFFPVPDRVQIHTPSFTFDRFPRLVSTLKTVRFLRASVRTIKPDRVLSFGELWNNFVLLSLGRFRRKAFVCDRSSPRKRFNRIQEALRTRLYARARGIIVQTRAAQELYARRWPTNMVHVVANPVPIPPLDEVPSAHQRVLSVGRLIDTKHHDHLLNVFAQVAKGTDWELVIVGDDAQRQANRERLVDIARNLGVSAQVRFVGAVPDVEPYYRRSSVFAFTSSSEGFPNALAEAMAHGLAVVSYDCVAGPSELIAHAETGFLVPVFDDAALEARLRELMQSEPLRNALGTSAHRSMQRFDSAGIASQFLALMRGG